MKNIIIFILVLMLIPSATAETALNSSDNSTENQSQIEQNKSITHTGIVLNASDYVQYKFSGTKTQPTLQIGEYTVDYQDINSVLKGAKYSGGIFINPEQPVELYEEIELKAEQSKIDPTQTIISGLTGAGAAYLVVRRKKAA